MRRMVVAVLVGLTLVAAACTPNPAGSDPRIVEAIVVRSNNLFTGSDVRVLGMRVGSVLALESAGQHVLVRMEILADTELPEGVQAHVRPVSLLGERFVQLDPPYVEGPTHAEGEVIPLERTTVPAETDEVLASFERFLASLDPETLAELVDVVADTIEGQGQGLNQLLDRGAGTIRILADSSEDLMATVRALGQFNATLATRDQRIEQVIRDWSTVAATLAEETEAAVSGVVNLRRLMTELRPLLDDHAEPLVTDLEILTTTLSTVDRNLDRVAQLVHGGRILFEGAGRAFDFPNARLRLLNQSEELGRHIQDRVTQRLAGLCLRLSLPSCADELFWSEQLPTELCLDGVVTCTESTVPVEDALADAIMSLPPEALERLAEEQRSQEPEPESEFEPQPEREPTLDRLPLPDPRLSQSTGGGSRDGFLDKLARLIGGRR